MNPIRYAGVVAFVDWISRKHPDIRSLRETPEDEFLELATEFEASKGMRIEEHHQVYLKWRSTHCVFSKSPTDQAALERLRSLQ